MIFIFGEKPNGLAQRRGDDRPEQLPTQTPATKTGQFPRGTAAFVGAKG